MSISNLSACPLIGLLQLSRRAYSLHVYLYETLCPTSFFSFSSVLLLGTRSSEERPQQYLLNQTMPVRRREAPCATYGVVPYYWKIKNTSLVALGALTVARSWTGVQSFAVPIGGGIHATGTCTTSGAPAPAVASTRTTAAARSRSPLGRYRQGLRERRSGAGLVVVKASLDDDVDDEFDPVREEVFVLLFEKSWGGAHVSTHPMASVVLVLRIAEHSSSSWSQRNA